MKERYLMDVKNGQEFVYSKGGYSRDSRWLRQTPVSGTFAIPTHKLVFFHLSNWDEYVKDTWETQPSVQKRMLVRLKELRRKPKLFKWVDYDGEIKGFVKITSWRKNRFDMVVNGLLIENNLEVVELLGEKNGL